MTRLLAVRSLVALLIALSIGLIVLGGLLNSPSFPITFNDLGDIFEQQCSYVTGLSCDRFRPHISGFVWPLIFLQFTLLIEYCSPAKTNQKLFSLGFRQDLTWFIFYMLLTAYMVSYFSQFLFSTANEYLEFMKIDYLDTLPVPLQIMLAILCVDFLLWFGHYVRHRVPFFWRFHSIHHSQKEINFFTTYRAHPVDMMISIIIRSFPLFVLQLNVALPTIIVWSLYKNFIDKFAHANVKTNFGPLRYILVTPQYHRIHHSIEEEHRDKNFGAIFTIWDSIFQTRHQGFNEYPDTGIPDKNFPHEESVKLINLLWTPIKQIVFPFKNFTDHSTLDIPKALKEES